jgi:hypothetical protein
MNSPSHSETATNSDWQHTAVEKIKSVMPHHIHRSSSRRSGKAVVGEGPETPANYALSETYRVLYTLNGILRVALIVFIIWALLHIPHAIHSFVKSAKSIVTGKGFDSFTQKENLQWLGASADVIRGDYENNQDSLAEKAIKADGRVTDIGMKSTFYSRERLSTPEEQMIEQQKKLAQN